MAGFRNDIVYANNADFSTASATTGSLSNGLITDGQIWTGSTATNIGGTHVNVGGITSPDASIIVNYSIPNITLQVSGGSTVGKTITGNSGGALNPTAGNWNIFGASTAAGTSPVTTSGSGSTLTINVQKSQAISSTDATKVGLANFNSADFSVDANGFVSIITGGFKWNDVSGAFSPLAQNGYFITGTANGTLPASPSQGDTIKFFVDHASQLLTITAAGTQIIRLATQVSSAGGTTVSTQQGDSVELVYRSSDTCWCAVAGFSGGWNFT